MDEEIKFRCTKEEKDLLNTLSAEIKITKSDYLRHLINSREKPDIKETKRAKRDREGKIKELLGDNYYGLGKIGVNLNQIAHYFNLEHLKVFDIAEPTIERLLILDKLNPNDLDFIRGNLTNLNSSISYLKGLIEELLTNKSKVDDVSKENLEEARVRSQTLNQIKTGEEEND